MYIYFSTYDPYDEKYDYFLDYIHKKEQETIVDNTNECAICLSTSTIANRLQNLKSIKIIDKSCDCNVYIHETCLRNWVKIALTCPICRSKLDYLDYSFAETSEKIIRISYLFLIEYKDILLILVCYLCFLQTCIFCIIMINYKINEELLYNSY
jgi:hypothetical protein